MKKLESLNNSLYEKFENNKVNNIAAITGGCKIATCTTVTTSNPSGTDEFSDESGTTGSSMVYGGYSDLKGDTCNGLAAPAPVGGSR